MFSAFLPFQDELFAFFVLNIGITKLKCFKKHTHFILKGVLISEIIDKSKKISYERYSRVENLVICLTTWTSVWKLFTYLIIVLISSKQNNLLRKVLKQCKVSHVWPYWMLVWKLCVLLLIVLMISKLKKSCKSKLPRDRNTIKSPSLGLTKYSFWTFLFEFKKRDSENSKSSLFHSI